MALTLFYTFEGGMTAVIWTDVVQMCMYVVGASVSFFVLIGKIPGGFGHALDVASAAGKAAGIRPALVLDKALHNLGRG
jgi:SSS family solute:Na+ symporter